MSHYVLTRGRACVGKRRYHTLDHAKHDAMRLRWRKGDAVAAYLCPFCDAWHVGHALHSRTPAQPAEAG